MKKERALELKSLILVYGTLVISSAGMDYFSHRHLFYTWTQSHLKNSMSIFLALTFVSSYIGIALITPKLFRWGVELEKLFSQILTPLSYLQVLYLSALSAIVEEWFFRGILMNHFGWILSSLIFGLCHFLPAPAVWRWSVISLVAGLCLGGLYEYSGSLWLVVMAHFLINAILIFNLNKTHIASPTLT